MRPSISDIYARLIILKYVVVHSLTTPLELLPELFAKWSIEEKSSFEKDMKNNAQGMIDSLEQMNLWDHLVSPWEKNFLQSSGSRMNKYAHTAASWRMECVGILMWALNQIPRWQKIDEEFNPDLLKQVKIGDPKAFGKLLIMRGKKELDEKRELIEFWHWRVRTRQLIEKGERLPDAEKMRKAGFNSYDDIVRAAAQAGRENGKLPELIDDDFVFMRKAFRALSEEEYEKASSIIMERHFAMNWLCGKAPGNRWDETPTDT